MVTFNFDNSTLLLNSLYFYFTNNPDQVPALSSFGHSPLISVPVSLFSSMKATQEYNFSLNHNHYRISPNIIKLTLSINYPQLYLYYSSKSDSDISNLIPLKNPITDSNLHKVNPKDNSIKFSTSIKNPIIYIHAYSKDNFEGDYSVSLPYIYIETNNFSLDITSEDNNHTLTINNYHDLLLDQTYNILLKDKVIHTFTGQSTTFNYTLKPNQIHVLTVSNDIIQIKSNLIYTITPVLKSNITNTYPGDNTIILSLDNHYNLIKFGNIYVNNELVMKNIDVNKMNLTLNNKMHNNITFKTLDNNVSTSVTLDYLEINPVLEENKIILDNWDSRINKVDLYNNNDLINTFMVNNKEIILNMPLEINNPKLSIKVNNIHLKVNDPNNLIKPVTTLYVSLDKDHKLYLPQNSLSYIYSSKTIYHSGSLTNLTYLGISTDTIVIEPTKDPLYIVASSDLLTYNYDNTITFQCSNILSQEMLSLPIKQTNINGIIDQINYFTIDLQPKYMDIQVLDSNININYIIQNNQILFTYDPGFEISSIFKIINSKSGEIYEIINVNYTDPQK
jgi:hypothetical protein